MARVRTKSIKTYNWTGKIADLPQKMITFYDRPAISDEGKANDLPFLVDFCKQEGIPVSTFKGWLKPDGPDDYKALRDAYEVCKELFARNLVTCALKSKYQPIFSIFTAKNILGWADRNEVSVETKGTWASVVRGRKRAA
jgi:hypothetical protein